MTPCNAPQQLPDSTPERALPNGTRLEEYEIDRLIAQGSLGFVYRAYDRVLKLHVAIKEYLPGTLAKRSGATQVVLREQQQAQCFERGRQAFADETRVLAHCRHPALPRVLRMLHHHGTACRVMHCITGPTLAEHRQALSAAPDAVTLRAWLDSLLGALDELHGQGWVHGAVSPSKIVVVPGHGPVLMSSDAVRSALVDDGTGNSASLAQSGCQPIELREPSCDRPRGPWTDLYALAATLHWYIGGQPPTTLTQDSPVRFEALGALWQRLHGGPPVAPASLGALDACLAESPHDRPQSVAQLRTLLEAQDAASRLQHGGPSSPWAMALEVPAHAEDDLHKTPPFVAAHARTITVAASAAAPGQWRAAPAQRWRRGAVGTALVLMLTVSLAAAAWIRFRPDPAPATLVAAPELPQPTPDAPPQLATVAPAAERGPETKADAMPKRPVVATAAPARAVHAAARTPSSPRAQCGARSGYAMYQCMQAKCAKREWASHAQCRNLREKRSLG